MPTAAPSPLRAGAGSRLAGQRWPGCGCASRPAFGRRGGPGTIGPWLAWRALAAYPRIQTQRAGPRLWPCARGVTHSLESQPTRAPRVQPPQRAARSRAAMSSSRGGAAPCGQQRGARRRLDTHGRALATLCMRVHRVRSQHQQCQLHLTASPLAQHTAEPPLERRPPREAGRAGAAGGPRGTTALDQPPREPNGELQLRQPIQARIVLVGHRAGGPGRAPERDACWRENVWRQFVFSNRQALFKKKLCIHDKRQMTTSPPKIEHYGRMERAALICLLPYCARRPSELTVDCLVCSFLEN
eukprot:scaffold2636_cov124-Isochrysis_galbana.AAC.2